MAIEYFSPSPLSHFDPAELLDVLSTGVVMLDADLCVVYANVGAQDLLAVGLNQARGHPFTELFEDSEALGLLLRRSLESEMLSRLDGSRLMLRQLGHEIKNPLGGLRGAAQLLDRELHDGSLKEYTTVIINEADRLRVLVDSMLGPVSPPQKDSVNIHELCEHVFHLLRSEAAEGITIERDYDPS